MTGMRRCKLLSSILFVFLSACVPDAGTSSNNRLTSQETEDGWKLLFDGETLGGWRGDKDRSAEETGWMVENGCLMNPASDGKVGGSGGDLLTEESFSDFEFDFEWRLEKGGNSGVKYFVRERWTPGPKLFSEDDGQSPVGHEYQILDDERHPDAQNGPDRTTAAFYGVLPPSSEKVLRPAGEFNKSRLIVSEERVEHWLNGQKVLEYRAGSPKVLSAVNQSKYKVIEHFGQKHKGPIMLQDHGNEICFRNLKIRSR